MSIYKGNDLVAGPGAPSRNVGEIVPSLLPLTDASLHLLDGSLISGSGTYGAFVTYMAGLVSTYPNLFVTESAWQTSVSAYGVCGKFVYDSTDNTVRLPKITGIIEGTVNVSALGDLVEAGLPNITGAATQMASGIWWESGAFKFVTSIASNNNSLVGTSSTASRNSLGFDASLSNPIYGNSSTVQPQTIKAYYYIVIANAVKTSIVADIDQIASDLNGKADIDLNNVTSIDMTAAMENSNTPVITENYVNGTSWYRVWSDGLIEQGGQTAITASDNTQTIALLKTMSDTDYFVSFVRKSKSSGNASAAYVQDFTIYSYDTSSFVLPKGYNGPVRWYVRGY